MPPKNKAASRAKEADSKQQQQQQPEKPQSLFERAEHLHAVTCPYDAKIEEAGINGLSPAERTAYINSQFAHHPAGHERLSKRAQKELWKQVNESNLPPRRIAKPTRGDWGKDKFGRDIGDYTQEQFASRVAKQAKLTLLEVESQAFKDRRFREQGKFRVIGSNPPNYLKLDEGAVEDEKTRRKVMASLKQDLYGETMGKYSMDPEWDDVIPIPQTEPEGALAAIAYPEDYAESMAYLRAVMAAREYTPRCLRLTEHIISMNPAHYTVWLYRFAIAQSMDIPILDELDWLDGIALDHQKNYQIWHHRQLLTDHYYPSIKDSPDEVRRFGRSERKFMMEMFAEDAKNYHVWSYRQYLVRKLGMWDQEELESIEGMIKEDVRNNSAWSHRFFLVFSNPEYATPDSHATEFDPKIPADIVDREIEYSKVKIRLAPQNQSPWNYLRGVLVKGGSKLGSVREFAEEYVKDLGAEGEVVKSTHALDLLTDIYVEAGEKDRADLCLRRLGEKWDRIRAGYWEWKRQMLQEEPQKS